MGQKTTESYALIPHKSKWCCLFSDHKDVSLIWIGDAELY